MKVNYKYTSQSKCVSEEGHVTLGLSPDISRNEKVSFLGKLKNPLVFRDAMIMLREIVISDVTQKKEERVEFFEWLNNEIESQVQNHEKNIPNIREELKKDMEQLLSKISIKDNEILKLSTDKKEIQKQLDKYDVWSEYNKIERKFWEFIKSRDLDLWFVLDPVITVHPDQVSFEAFSIDESIYGCLSIEMDEFEMKKEPVLGTTNIDFSEKLAKQMERFRTYSDVELSVNPEGFTVDTGIMPEYIEKKIDLPDTWIKGFNQVSSAANLNGVTIELDCIDMYDICSFLLRHKANKSPRYMKWVLKKNKPIKIVFEPFGKEITLKAIYKGEKDREEKIWGRRRWLVVQKLIPLAKSFKVKLLGFGMPQFIIADLGKMKMTIGFSSWSSNDWVKGTAFNIMSGFIGLGNYKEVYSLLKEKRFMTIDDICEKLNHKTKTENISGIGTLLKKGEGYFDAINGFVRFRMLLNEEIPSELYETTPTEFKVKNFLDAELEQFKIKFTKENEYVFSNLYKIPNIKYNNSYYKHTRDYEREFDTTKTSIVIDLDGQISNIMCECSDFRRSSQNMSNPCAHILALYITSVKFTRINFEYDREYKINDIMELLL